MAACKRPRCRAHFFVVTVAVCIFAHIRLRILRGLRPSSRAGELSQTTNLQVQMLRFVQPTCSSCRRRPIECHCVNFQTTRTLATLPAIRIRNNNATQRRVVSRFLSSSSTVSISPLLPRDLCSDQAGRSPLTFKRKVRPWIVSSLSPTE